MLSSIGCFIYSDETIKSRCVDKLCFYFVFMHSTLKPQLLFIISPGDFIATEDRLQFLCRHWMVCFAKGLQMDEQTNIKANAFTKSPSSTSILHQNKTHSWFPKHPNFFILTVMLHLSSSKTFTLQSKGFHFWTDLFEYMICQEWKTCLNYF